jgi:hypothetical protein
MVMSMSLTSCLASRSDGDDDSVPQMIAVMMTGGSMFVFMRS